MKKVILPLILLSMFLFAGCDLVEDILSQLDSNDTENELEEADNQDEIKQEETSESNVEAEEINEQDENPENLENVVEEDGIKESEVSGDSDVAKVLEASYEAMAEVTSHAIKASLDYKENDAGEPYEETIDIAAESLLEGPFTRHFILWMNVSEDDDPSNESYVHEDKHYIKEADGWVYQAAGERAGMSSYIGQIPIEEVLAQADKYELEEDEDHYILKLIENDLEASHVMYGEVMELMEELMDMTLDPLVPVEEVNMDFEIIIDKATFLVESYQIQIQEEAEDAADDYTIEENITILIEDYNKYDKNNVMDIPEEVLSAEALD